MSYAGWTLDMPEKEKLSGAGQAMALRVHLAFMLCILAALAFGYALGGRV